MFGHQNPGPQNRVMMDRPPSPLHHQHTSPNNFRQNNTGLDSESQYTNPYIEQHKQQMAMDDPSNQRNKVAIHRPRLNRKQNPEEKTKSSLTTNFDPMKDRHMWAMWRTAVNGRIVDQVRRNEQFKSDSTMVPDDFSSAITETDPRNNATYGKDLTSVPPLSRFIRLNDKSKNIAHDLMNEGQGKLETTQFIYYGLPRVTVNTGNNSRINGNHSNYHHNNNINGLNYVDTIPPDYNDMAI